MRARDEFKVREKIGIPEEEEEEKQIEMEN